MGTCSKNIQSCTVNKQCIPQNEKSFDLYFSGGDNKSCPHPSRNTGCNPNNCNDFTYVRGCNHPTKPIPPEDVLENIQQAESIDGLSDNVDESKDSQFTCPTISDASDDSAIKEVWSEQYNRIIYYNTVTKKYGWSKISLKVNTNEFDPEDTPQGAVLNDNKDDNS